MEWLEANIESIWFLIIAFFVLYYAIADGLDLGVGIMTFFTPDEKMRGTMMASLESIWQSNQTWLVLLGGMLFGAFPLFYSLALSAFYVPIMVMLFGLMFRGVALEFRSNARKPSFWVLCFGVGSVVVALAQGFAMGGIFYGIPMAGNTFTGNIWSWFHPYSVVFALGVLAGYVMLGANYLILKTDGEIQRRSFLWSLRAAILMLIVSTVIYVWTFARHSYMADKWLVWPDLVYVAIFPVLALFAFGMYVRELKRRSEFKPFVWNVIIVLCAFAGLNVGFYPYIIPNMVTIKTAAVSSPNTLIFMLAAMVILLPIILIYVAYKHWVFRGKIAGERCSTRPDGLPDTFL